jgi:hypothetical protein
MLPAPPQLGDRRWLLLAVRGRTQLQVVCAAPQPLCSTASNHQVTGPQQYSHGHALLFQGFGARICMMHGSNRAMHHLAVCKTVSAAAAVGPLPHQPNNLQHWCWARCAAVNAAAADPKQEQHNTTRSAREPEPVAPMESRPASISGWSGAAAMPRIPVNTACTRASTSASSAAAGA